MKIRQGIRISRGVGKPKAPPGQGSGVGGPLFKKFHAPLTENVPQVGDLHPVTPGNAIVASVGSGAQLPHTDVATHPVVPPPRQQGHLGDLSIFLCLSEDNQVVVQAGTAMGDAAEARWDTIQLQRGGMLLMVATSRHHGLPALPDSKDGLHGAFFFNLWTLDPRHRHHQPNTTHLDPSPPQ